MKFPMIAYGALAIIVLVAPLLVLSRPPDQGQEEGAAEA